jgi:predicted nucleotide-binding protein
MNIESKLKPLFANLKRIQIGKYLYTKEFTLFAIENNFDDVWEKCKSAVIGKKGFISLDFHSTEDEEEAFAYLMTLWYEQDYNSFDDFISAVLLNFAKWHTTKLDFQPIHHNLKQIGLSDKKLLEFTKESRRVRDSKPETIKETQIENRDKKKIKLDNKKVFIVHGHDDKSRLELVKILKDDLGLEPIVIQEEPNVSIETIIVKFERLAKDCSSALILFTPDDNANGKFRARQNVILELGYFLGKFHDAENRKIAIIKNGDIEIPSDISGVLYLEYQKNIKETFYDLKKQFETWGIK